MAPGAGKRLWEMAANTRGILAVEWLGACQGLDFREGLKSTPPLEQARQALRGPGDRAQRSQDQRRQRRCGKRAPGLGPRQRENA